MLSGMPPGHQCGRLHGHSYIVQVEVTSGDVDARGMVVDFGELNPLKADIDGRLDHRTLNEVFPDLNPTAENLAHALFERWKEIVHGLGGTLEAVRVHETATAWAEYRHG